VISVIDFLTVVARRFHCLAGNSAIIRPTFQPFRCVMPLLAVDLQQSMAALFTWCHFWRGTVYVYFA